MDSSQAGVAGGDAVASLVFEVIEEAAHQHGVQIGKIELGGFLSGPRFGEGQQQPERVTVGVDGVRAGISLTTEPADEEGLHGGSDGAHRDTARAVSTRSLARDNSSGTPVKYQ